MSSCESFGRPKVKHSDKTTAILHAHKLNKGRLWKSQAYRCNKCGFWHAGRIPKRVEYLKLVAQREAVDERLVGKLIQALKDTINRTPNNSGKK